MKQSAVVHIHRLFCSQAWRKPGLEVVAKAFLQDGIEGAFSAFAALPHTEADYKKQFDFNTNVTKICYKDDNGCNGTKEADEVVLWVSIHYCFRAPLVSAKEMVLLCPS